jgi:hypothetical protein
MTSFPQLAPKDESTARDAEGSDSRSEIGFVKRPPSHRHASGLRPVCKLGKTIAKSRN